MEAQTYPVRFSVDYPDRPLSRLTTAFRIFTVIPIAIVLNSLSGWGGSYGRGAETTTIALGPLRLPSRACFLRGRFGGLAAPCSEQALERPERLLQLLLLGDQLLELREPGADRLRCLLDHVRRR